MDSTAAGQLHLNQNPFLSLILAKVYTATASSRKSKSDAMEKERRENEAFSPSISYGAWQNSFFLGQFTVGKRIFNLFRRTMLQLNKVYG